MVGDHICHKAHKSPGLLSDSVVQLQSVSDEVTDKADPVGTAKKNGHKKGKCRIKFATNTNVAQLA